MNDEPGPLAALGGVVSIAALVIAVFLSYGNKSVGYQFQARHAMELLSQGRYMEAQVLYESILPHYAGTDARLGLSYAYLARRDGDSAENQARLALRSAPADWKPAAWAQLGRALLFKGSSGEAEAAWEQAKASAEPYKSLPPIEAEARSALWHLGMVRWRQGDFEEAKAQLQKLAGGQDVYAASALVKLAQLLAPTDPDVAQKYSERAVHLGGAGGAAVPDLRVPGLEEGFTDAEIARITGELDRALADIGKLKASGATEGQIAAAWGSAYLQQNEPYLAKAQLERAVSLEPGLSDAHAYLGLVLFQLGEADKALGELKVAARLDPSRPLPHQALARVYVSKQEWDEAMAELSTLKRLEPNSVTTHLQLADYYTRRGAYEAAEEEYGAAVTQARADPDTPSSLDAALALARFYEDVRGQGCENGLPFAQESLAKHPGDPASLDAVGWALVLCGKAESALSSLEKAVQGGPDVARYRYHLGRAYADLGRFEEARQQYTRVMDLDPGGPWEQQARSELPNLPPAQ